MITMNRCNRLALLVVYAALGACASNPPPPAPQRMASQTPVHKAVVDTGKGDPQARFAAALALMHDGRNDEAEIALLVLSQDFPQFSGPSTDLGILYAKAKKNAAAVSAFNAAIKARPDNAVALNWLGQLSRERGDYPHAEQFYRRAIAAQAGYAPAHFNLAILYDAAMHRPDLALVQYQAYEKLAGADAQPMVAVWIHELQGQTIAAGGTPPAGASQ
ncbi:tetratricopeptide repeat protein [Solimonas terrae]|uniref:Tetratricopeptide repeat protein n=1 Tax=Solimonas terrae TaxID=1396819 RepID=A0A6M2BMN1_9GAMM|nr:tetratricopeptide repeat protein [Solimonas terrae]NGY03415.1 tetratricopeptide repeat protein [Solimonas terrae]